MNNKVFLVLLCCLSITGVAFVMEQKEEVSWARYQLLKRRAENMVTYIKNGSENRYCLLKKYLRFYKRDPEGLVKLFHVPVRRKLLLYYAAVYGNKAVVKNFLKKGADPTAPDQGGKTVFERLFKEKKFEEMERFIVACGECNIYMNIKEINKYLSILAEDMDEELPLPIGDFLKEYIKVVEMVDCSKKQSLAVKLRFLWNRPFLCLASIFGSLEFVQKLLIFGANPNAFDNQGVTVLMHLVQLKQVVPVRRFLTACDSCEKSILDIQDFDGLNVFQHAERFGCGKIKCLLREYSQGCLRKVQSEEQVAKSEV